MTLDERLRCWRDATDALEPSPDLLRRLRRREAVPQRAPWGGVLGLVGLTAVLAAGVGAAVLLRLEDQAEPDLPPPAPTFEAQQRRLEDLLRTARTLMEAERFTDAKTSIHQVLELEPIHEEANELLRRATVDQGCRDVTDRAKALAELGQAAAALERLEQLDPSCSQRYQLRALELAKAPTAEVLKERADYCARMAKAKQWAVAEQACGGWLRLACQGMPDDAWAPPKGVPVQLTPGSPRPGAWRPAQEPLRLLLLARSRLGHTEPLTCPRRSALRGPPAPPDPSAQCRAAAAARFPHPAFGASIGLYFDGKQPREFLLPLQRDVSEVNSLSALHPHARDVMQDLALVFAFWREAETALGQGSLERAAVALRRAMDLDERLVFGGALGAEERAVAVARCTSWPRRQALAAVAETALQQGREAFERNDLRAGCRAVKVGYAFTRTHSDLLRAVDRCSRRAGELVGALGPSPTCAALQEASDFAVPGDGYGDRIGALAAPAGCTLREPITGR